MNLVKRRRNCLRKIEKMNNGGVCVFKKNVIYCYINKLNGHTYIGQSINFKERLRRHYRKGCKQGYNWEYESEDGKRISSVSLEKLLKKMDENDYPLIILDKEKAKITLMGVSANADHFLGTYTETRKVYSRQA